MLAIIEGNESSGKSTVIREINKTLNATVLKIKIKKEWFLNNRDIELACEVGNDLISQLTKSNELIICDRGFISSLVYAKVYKRKYNFNYIYKEIIPKLKDSCLIVYLYTDSININLKRKKRDKFIEPKKYNEIQEGYNEVMNMLEHKYYFTILRLNTSKLNLSECRDSILKALANFDNNR